MRCKLHLELPHNLTTNSEVKMKITQKNALISAVTLCVAVAATGLAFAADESKAQKGAAKYRKSTFIMVNHHMGVLGAMVKGKVDFDLAVYTKNAEALAAISQLASTGFAVEGTVKGSRAKNAIWENKTDFDEKLTAFQTASTALAAAAKTGDADKAKAAFGDVGKSCKGCHTDYRKKKQK
jgi:cytochrome c556